MFRVQVRVHVDVDVDVDVDVVVDDQRHISVSIATTRASSARPFPPTER
jgi:hypothetical protein